MNNTNLLNRRRFISRAACLTAATGLFMGQTIRARAQNTAGQPPKFKLFYAPHPGMFKASPGDNEVPDYRLCAAGQAG